MTRREFALGAAGTAASAVAGVGAFFWKAGQSNQPVAAGFGDPTYVSGLTLPPTPCPANASATPSFVEGPFYSPNSPLKDDFRESGWEMVDPMVLSGRVVDPRCQPIAGAVIDLWHVDQNAEYDNAGHRYRGHTYTDADGLWQITSIHPTAYSLQGFWTTAHVHVKAQAPGTDLLTTQLYFPREAVNNAKDDGWRPELEVIGDADAAGVYDFRFDFVLER